MISRSNYIDDDNAVTITDLSAELPNDETALDQGFYRIAAEYAAKEAQLDRIKAA